MLFSASPQNTGLRSRGPQTPKRTETVRQLIKPSLPSKTPGLGMNSPASSQKPRGCQASPPPSLHLPYSQPPCLPSPGPRLRVPRLRVLWTFPLLPAPGAASATPSLPSGSCLECQKGLAPHWNKQSKSKKKLAKNTESLSFGPSALLNAGTPCSLNFKWSKRCTSFQLPPVPLVCLGSYASGPSRSPFSAPSFPWP